jgi:hypothetical protein
VNLCAISVMLCLVISPIAGYMAGGLRGGAAVGSLIGLTAAFGFAFLMIWLERAAARRQGSNAIMPYAAFMLVAMTAPFASGAITVVLARAVAEKFRPTDRDVVWAIVLLVGLICAAGASTGGMNRVKVWLCATGAAICGLMGAAFVLRSYVADEFWYLVGGAAVVIVALATFALLVFRKPADLSVEAESDGGGAA